MPAKMVVITTHSNVDGSTGQRTVKMSQVKTLRQTLASQGIVVTSSRPVRA